MFASTAFHRISRIISIMIGIAITGNAILALC